MADSAYFQLLLVVEDQKQSACSQDTCIVSHRFLNPPVWNEPHNGHQRIAKTCQQGPQKCQWDGYEVNEGRHHPFSAAPN